MSDETTERISLGSPKVAAGGPTTIARYGDLPPGTWQIYAERVPEKPLNVRMADCFNAPHGAAMDWRMQGLIDKFDLVERSKVENPEPVEVPEWVQDWLSGDIEPLTEVLRGWVSEAVISGAVRVEKTEVPESVLKDARWVARNWAAANSRAGRVARWALEQAGEPNGD